jgi:hypothetical protein
MDAETAKRCRNNSANPYGTPGWSRTAQDAAESLASTHVVQPAPQPFLKKRMGYSTVGAFLAAILFLLMLAAFLVAVGAAAGPWDGCLCF